MRHRPIPRQLWAATLCILLPASAGAAPADVIWARKTTANITLDGVLNEPSWAKAESLVVRYGVDAGVPGSGWKAEAGVFIPGDSTKATLKFLVKDNQLYFAAVVKDSSVGGSTLFNRFDGLIMSLKNHADTVHPKPPAEYLYGWWYPLLTDPQPPGQLPRFKGLWANDSTTVPRDSTQVANWDARTVVNGLSNSDATIDQGYTVEMRFNLTAMGYNVTQPAGDVLEWNISIYDCDWFWPFNGAKFFANRVWVQSPWGNAMWYNQLKIHARPDVTIQQTRLPPVGHELAIREWTGAAPVMDGQLTDAAWTSPTVYTFDIRFGDAALLQTYDGLGPFRSGWYQPIVNDTTAFVADSSDARVKIFWKGTDLYLGFDVNDEVVQYHPSVDRWDGFIVTVNDKVVRGPDNQLLGYRHAFQVAQNGTATAHDDLATFVAAGDAQVVLALKPGTSVDTTGTGIDAGYRAELKLDLTAMGYPVGLGDRILWIGVNHLDGDSYLPVEDSYGTRTWWFREYQGQCCPAHALLAPVTAVDVSPIAQMAPTDFFARSFPNPSSSPTIQYSLPQSGRVTLDLYDVSGRLVDRREMGVQEPGVWQTVFDGRGMTSGVYFYRLKVQDPSSGSLRASLDGKTVLLN